MYPHLGGPFGLLTEQNPPEENHSGETCSCQQQKSNETLSDLLTLASLVSLLATLFGKR